MDSMNMRKAFDTELKRLETDLLKLGNLAQDAVMKGVWALKEQDVRLAEEVLRGDDVLDSLTGNIDAQCLQIIARFQPVALDLRTLSAILHMAVDLERIGDYGVSLAKAAKALSRERLIKPLLDIPRMAQILKEMIDTALGAFLDRSAEEARKVCLMDDQMDDIQEQIFRELLLLMMENPRTIEQATRLLFVARTLERAGDHATNLAERTIYMVTGKVEKSSAIRRPKEEE
ncbi:phosphate signaling complex protein PhoU [Aminiphilus sp.]|jgi:phosphate transport system protein|uniref:phosphate signaling complex protein PhoU n=1 Tax=Aminiphilus sp. TaxID=1872488 RepID=UPI002614C403|nr:phosphate signaling complex protein PhoU [Aminiphilus sp.]